MVGQSGIGRLKSGGSRPSLFRQQSPWCIRHLPQRSLKVHVDVLHDVALTVCEHLLSLDPPTPHRPEPSTLNSIDSDRDCYCYRISKFDPAHNPECTADWTSVSDIGRRIAGHVLTRHEYEQVESKYLDALRTMLDSSGSQEVTISDILIFPAVPRLHNCETVGSWMQRRRWKYVAPSCGRSWAAICRRRTGLLSMSASTSTCMLRARYPLMTLFQRYGPWASSWNRECRRRISRTSSVVTQCNARERRYAVHRGCPTADTP